jgi:urea transport system substrate-binding protein
MPPNHPMAKPVMIGEMQADGQFSIAYESPVLPAEPLEPICRGKQGSRCGLVLALGLGGCTAPKYTAF